MTDHLKSLDNCQLKILAGMSDSICVAEDMKSTLRKVIDVGKVLVAAHCGTVGLLKHGQMVFSEYNKIGTWIPIDYHFKLGEGASGWIIEHKKPFISNNPECDLQVDRQSWKTLKFYNLINIPIISQQGQLLGSLNIHNSADRRPFNERDVDVLKVLAKYAALAIERFQEKTIMEASYKSEHVFNNLLSLSLKEESLSDLLKEALNIILETPWLPSNRMGAIFLVEDDPEVLVMNAHHGMPEELQAKCARISFGCCVCGSAAANRESLFVKHTTGSHNHCWDVLGEHAHYAIPILKDNAVLGLFTLYLDKNHQFSPHELEFLGSIACILVGIILRSQSNNLLIESEQQYRSLVESTAGVWWRLNVASNQFTFISNQVEKLLGYPIDSWTDFDTWAERIHPEDRIKTTRLCFEATSRGEDHNLSYRMVAANGETVWVRDIVRVLSRDRMPFELVGFMIDISQEKQMN